MLELEAGLARRLAQLRVRVDVRDDNTVFLRNVPTNERFFNKSRTNLLVKRPQEGMPFLVCVDEDLEYAGADRTLTRAFTASQRRQGWRVLFLEPGATADFERVVENALRALGFDGTEPAWSLSTACAHPAPAGRLLAQQGTDLTQRVREAAAEPTVGRTEETEEVLSCVLQWQPRLAIITGNSGVGKTNLLHALARKLFERQPPLRVVSVELGSLMAGTLFDSERENLLAAALQEAAAAPHTVLALEHLELALFEAPRGLLLLKHALEQGVRLVGTMVPDFRYRFEFTALARHLHEVEVSELGARETCEVLLALRERVACHHRIRLPESLVQAVVERAQSLAGHFPAKAIALLDAAATRTALSGAPEATLCELYVAATSFIEAKQ